MGVNIGLGMPKKGSKEDRFAYQYSGKTMPLVNHAFARVTPAIFVIVVVFAGSEQQRPGFTGSNANSSFSPFWWKPPLFGKGQRHNLAKAPLYQVPLKF